VTPQTGVCKGTATKPLMNNTSDAFIDDFETAGSLTSLLAPGWYGFNDVMPAMANNSFQPTRIAGGAAGTAHALEYAGTGGMFYSSTNTTAFGVGLTYNLAIDPAAGQYCVDISNFQGVSFWAKAGPGAMMGTGMPTISVNFVLPSTNMAMTNDAGMPTAGDCLTNCYNHPKVSIGPLSTTWSHYTADFSAAHGGSAPVGTVLQELVFLTSDPNWDFELDEISFYQGTAPTGPVSPGGGGGGG
jgi:hypothetical protein